MKTKLGCMLVAFVPLLALSAGKSATVPITLEHNRMFVSVEFQRKDGSFRTARVWVDTGNPAFFMTEALARDLGAAIVPDKENPARKLIAAAPVARLGGMTLNFEGVSSLGINSDPAPGVRMEANLPATVLRHYQVVFDYPNKQLTLAEPGVVKPRGTRIAASVHPKTAIVQVDVTLDGESRSFAIDNGATYTYVSNEVLGPLAAKHREWPHSTGAIGCANMWGWPQEPQWPMLRAREIAIGAVRLAEVGMAGVQKGATDWYSQKTAWPVVGMLGPNALKAFRVEIDYAGSAVYLEKTSGFDAHDMDLVGLTLQPTGETFVILGVVKKNGKPSVEGVEAGDKLVRVDSLETRGASMGAVVDALRGKPGDRRQLVIERSGKRFAVKARVERFL